MRLRRLPGLLLNLFSLLLTVWNLVTAIVAYPSLPTTLSGGLGKPVALLISLLAAVTWLLLLLAFFRSARLLLPLPFRGAAMDEARAALADTLALLSLFSGVGFFTAEKYLLMGKAVSGWLYALFFFLFLLTAVYLAYAILRIAKRRGVAEKEVTEAEAQAAWDDFIQNKK